MRGAGHVVDENCIKILARKHDLKRQLDRCWGVCEAILGWNLMIKYDTKTWTGFMRLKDTDQWQDLINTQKNLQTGNFLGTQVRTDSAPSSGSIVRVTAHSYLTIYG
jgi:hypothetical protein